MSENPSPIGAAVTVAGQTITAFKSEPVLLLIIILNIIMLIATGIVGWAVVNKVGDFLTTQEGYRHQERLEVLSSIGCLVNRGGKGP